MRLKLLLFLFSVILVSNSSYSQSEEDRLFIQKIDTIVENLIFSYQYDQALREYILFKTFDKSVVDSIESLDNEKDRREYIFSSNFKSDLAKDIWKYFIHPADDIFTEKLIAITDSVGFPSYKRIKQ